MKILDALFRLRRSRAEPRESALPASINRTISDALSAAGLQAPRAEPPSVMPSHLRQRSVDSPDFPPRPAEPGRFFWRAIGDGAEVLDYKLYVPASYSAVNQAVPLIVMLHGCTQDPDDFALGTRMNALGEQHGAIVAYPQQPSRANVQKCWNWFRPEDQLRDSGEPKRIAMMTRAVIAEYGIDSRRVFIAGMSAGGAMALVAGHTYPDLFAAVGVHSGLPYQSANNVVSALSVMRDARTAQISLKMPRKYSTPTIVFRGSGDRTVNPANGETIVLESARDWAKSALVKDPQVLVLSGGMTSERTIYREVDGTVAIESWLIRDGGHLWSGGDARGSHTDARGPDASSHLMRFFLERRT